MHLMVDLETLATTPDAAILTIGACKFDPYGKTITDQFYERIDLDSQNRHIDENTIAWWSKQDKKIQEDAFGEGGRIKLSEAMKKLYRFGLGTKNIWSHGSIFDVVILENVASSLQQGVTWNFWEIRDTRTLFDIANVEVQVEGKHNALADATAQSYAVQKAYRVLLH